MGTVTVTNTELKTASLLAIPALLPQAAAIEAFSHAVEIADKEIGQTTTVFVYDSGITTDNFNSSTRNYETSATGSQSTTGVEVTYTDHLISDATSYTAAQLAKLDMNEIVLEHISSVVDKVNMKIFNGVNETEFTEDPVVVTADNFDIVDIIDLEVDANDLNWKATGRSLVISDTYMANLKSGDFLTAVTNSDTNGAAVAMKFQPLHGFEIIPSNGIKRSAVATSENLVGFIAQKSALAIASAYPESVAHLGPVQVQRVKVGGIAVQINMQLNLSTHKYTITAETMFGMKKLRNKSLKRIISAVIP